MKVIYTRHAERKFKQEKYIRQLKITKSTVKYILKHPTVIDDTRGEKITAISNLDVTHSLIVVYKINNSNIIIITFYPAEKGRYENKILQRG